MPDPAAAVRTLAQRALDAADPVHAALIDGVAATSGLHPTSLGRLVERWAAAWRQADRCVHRGVGHLPAGSWAPIGTVALVAPGNLCVATWQAMLEPLLAGNRMRVRPGSGDPRAPGNLQTALGLVEPGLAARITVQPVRRDEPGAWADFLAGADALAVYGGDAAVQAVLGQAAAARFVGRFRGHGHMQSCAVVPAATAASPERFAAVAAGLAEDALLADGRGCMSCRAVYVLGNHSPTQLRERAAVLAGALRTVAARLPAGRIAPAWQAAARMQAEELAFAAAADPDGAALHEGAGWWLGAWLRQPVPAVPWTGDEAHLGPGARGLVLRPVRDWPGLVAHLGSWRGRLSTVALAGELDAEARAALQQLGVHRICAPGDMQAPAADRAPDGHPPLAAYVRLLDTE